MPSFRRLALLALAFVMSIFYTASLAFAQAAAPVNTIIVPWGDWTSTLLNSAASVFAAVLIWVVGKFVPSLAKNFLTNDAVMSAVNYAFAAVSGAVKGKELSIATTNEVLFMAERYLVANTPHVASWLGDMIQPAILAKLSALGAVPATASSGTTGVTIPVQK